MRKVSKENFNPTKYFFYRGFNLPYYINWKIMQIVMTQLFVITDLPTLFYPLLNLLPLLFTLQTPPSPDEVFFFYPYHKSISFGCIIPSISPVSFPFRLLFLSLPTFCFFYSEWKVHIYHIDNINIKKQSIRLRKNFFSYKSFFQTAAFCLVFS